MKLSGTPRNQSTGEAHETHHPHLRHGKPEGRRAEQEGDPGPEHGEDREDAGADQQGDLHGAMAADDSRHRQQQLAIADCNSRSVFRELDGEDRRERERHRGGTEVDRLPSKGMRKQSADGARQKDAHQHARRDRSDDSPAFFGSREVSRQWHEYLAGYRGQTDEGEARNQRTE
nr:hypothetical protein [Rhizobacter sp. Root1221]